MEWDRYLVSYPSLKEEEFSKEIVRHEELYPESFDCTSGFCHQEMIARYMSYYTLYDSLLVIHEMGTGKTGVAIALMDTLKEQQNIPRILFLCNNSTIEQNFYTEVKKYSRYFRKTWEDMSSHLPEDKKTSRWNAVFMSQGLISQTYQKFAKEIGSLTDDQLLQQYKDCLVICDEAHHLNFQYRNELSLKEKKLGEIIYDEIYRFFKVLGVHKKALVMTGTPIRDQPEEIVLLFNLILVSQQIKLPVDQEFLDDFLKIKRNIEIPILSQKPGNEEEKEQDQEDQIRKISLPIYEWATQAEQRLFQLLRGKVSFLRQQLSRVRIEYSGEVLFPMEHLRLRSNFMSEFQEQSYLLCIPGLGMGSGEENEDRPDDMVISDYTQLYQASLFVFPWYQPSGNVEGLVGEAGFSKFIDFKIETPVLPSSGRISKSNRYALTFRWKDEDPKRSSRVWPPDVWARLTSRDTSFQDKINILQTYSTIYADFLECFFGNVQQLCYVYSEWVKGSGMMVLALILKTFFGFTMITRASQIQGSKERESGFRFIFINDLFHIRDSEVQQLLSYFNHPDNAKGKYCQILLSTGKTKEGISVLNIQQIHILTPSWNFADVSQAIARGLRKNSHAALLKSGMEDVTVRVFLHTALLLPSEDLTPEEKKEALFLSIDFQRYARSEIKDRNARLMYRFLTKSAWDCPWAKSSNQIQDDSFRNTRDCDYEECNYTCYGEDRLPVQSQRLDITWLTFYAGEQQRQVLLQLSSVMQKSFGQISILDLKRKIQEKVGFPVTELLLSQVIEMASQNRTLFSSFDGQQKYLYSNGGVVTLIDHPFLSIGYSNKYQHDQYQVYNLVDLVIPTSSCRLGWDFKEYEKEYQTNSERIEKWVQQFIFLFENVPNRKSLSSLFEMWANNPSKWTNVIKRFIDILSGLTENEVSLSIILWEILEMIKNEYTTLYPSLLIWEPETATSWDDVERIFVENQEYDKRNHQWKLKENGQQVGERVITPISSKKELEWGSPDFERLITNNEAIGFYAIIKDADTFLIRDVRNKELFVPNTNTEMTINKRNVPSGLNCSSFKVQCVIYILLLFLKMDPSLRADVEEIVKRKYEKKRGLLDPTPANLERMKKLAWFAKLTSDTTSPALFTPELLEENIKDIYMLGLLKRDADMCPLLRRWFIKHQLYI
uniref:Helicase ATP-binding domain-containing protein n=1 Tax=viral metagenome TaxID=1070528 RepID=A0A6C0D0S8_9ZZZZ